VKLSQTTKPFDLTAAVDLLRSDLVWSDDFDTLRDSLANLLELISMLPASQVHKLEPALYLLVADLLDDGQVFAERSN
jgi:hypothetical protein